MKRKREYIIPHSRGVSSFKPGLMVNSPRPDERRIPEEEEDGLHIYDEGDNFWEKPEDAL